MTIEQAKATIKAMTPGFTKVINGHVVTKWRADSAEVGAFGHATSDFDSIARVVASEPDGPAINPHPYLPTLN